MIKQIIKGWISAIVVMVPTMVLHMVPIGRHLTDSDVEDAVVTGIYFGIFAAVYTAVVVAAYGIPFFLALRWLGIANLWTFLLIAIAPWIIIMTLSDSPARSREIYIVASVSAASAFWIFARHVAKRHRPPQQGNAVDAHASRN